MNASFKKQSSAPPVVLGLLGLLAVAGGVFLFLQYKTNQDAKLKKAIALIQAGPTAAAPAATETAPEPASQEAPADDKDTAPVATEPDDTDAASKGALDSPADEAPQDTGALEQPEPEEVVEEAPAPEPAPDLGPGKWRFKVTTRPLDIGERGETAVDAAAEALLEDDNDKLRVTGFNSPKHSSTMAKNIARKVRGMISEEGVKSHRILTVTGQDDDVETFEVLIELIKRD